MTQSVKASDDKLAELIAIYDEDQELVAFLRELQSYRQRVNELAAALKAILDVEEGIGETDRPHMIAARSALKNLPA